MTVDSIFNWTVAFNETAVLFRKKKDLKLRCLDSLLLFLVSLGGVGIFVF